MIDFPPRCFVESFPPLFDLFAVIEQPQGRISFLRGYVGEAVAFQPLPHRKIVASANRAVRPCRRQAFSSADCQRPGDGNPIAKRRVAAYPPPRGAGGFDDLGAHPMPFWMLASVTLAPPPAGTFRVSRYAAIAIEVRPVT
jgi:hypothetical protein